MARKSTPRKQRADSKEQAVVAMIHADKAINPPDDMEMNKIQTVIFHEIISEFAKVDWTSHTIRLAAMLARAMWALQNAQEQLFGSSDNPDFTTVNARGTVVADPLVSVCQNLAGQILASRRSLALHAIAGKNSVDVGKTRGINKKNQEDAPDDDDELLARPKVS